jgi:hypothetical protein
MRKQWCREAAVERNRAPDSSRWVLTRRLREDGSLRSRSCRGRELDLEIRFASRRTARRMRSVIRRYIVSGAGDGGGRSYGISP